MEAHATRLTLARVAARAPRERLPHAVAAGAALTIASGLALHATGSKLGAGLPPFTAEWRPDVAPEGLVAFGLLAAAVLAGPRLVSRPRSPLGFSAVVLGLSLGLRLAMGAARDGPDRWAAVFGTDPEAQNEYLPALAALDPGVRPFLDHFAETALTLPIHPSAHPPGVLLSLHWLGIGGAHGAAALVIAGGALTVPLAYILARRLLDEPRARVAALLVMLSPASLLYGATSFDALFAALATGAAALLVARRNLARAAGGVAVAVVSFFSFALMAVGAWSVVVVARRHGVRSALALAGTTAAAVGGLYAVLYASTGFDPIGSVAAASDAYAVGISGARPYAYWVFGSPVAFLVAMGLPLAWYALRALSRAEATAVALTLVVVLAATLGFTKAETERIWLFMIPLAAVAAASALPLSRVRPVLALLALQGISAELLFWTIW